MLAAVLVSLNLTEVLLLLRLNGWNRDLFDALERRDDAATLLGYGRILVLLALGFAVASWANLHTRRRLALGWRRWLTLRLTQGWLAAGGPGTANADGRIAEDARIATEEALELASSGTHAVIRLSCFVGVLWTLSGHPAFRLGGVLVNVPGYLLWVAMLYAALGVTCASLLGRPLVLTTEQRQGMEADYRAGLLGAPTGNASARARLSRMFEALAETFHRQSQAVGRLQLFGVANVRLGAGLPLLVATPAYLAGVVTLGWVIQASQAFLEVAAALNWPVDNMPRIAIWRASAQRVVALHMAGLPAGGLASQAASAYMPGLGAVPRPAPAE